MKNSKKGSSQDTTHKTSRKSSEHSRRDFLHRSLALGGGLGYRSLLLGLPPAFISARVMAASERKFLIFAERGRGDPMNANVPGSYIAGVRHPKAAEATLMPDLAAGFENPVPFDFGSGQSILSAKAWAELPAELRSRMHFVHHATGASGHGSSGFTMTARGAIKNKSGNGAENLPSVHCQESVGSLGTLQTKPISLDGELTFQSAPQPVTSPSMLKELFVQSKGIAKASKVMPLRDEILDSLYRDLKANGTPAQRRFLDDYVISRSQARLFSDKLSEYLTEVNGDGAANQMRTAVALIALNATPCVRIGIPFGEDNHSDGTLEQEIEGSINGIAAIQVLWEQLNAFSLQDKVVFAAMNVFGRTLGTRYLPSGEPKGRDHNPDHSVLITFGPQMKGGVSGGIEFDPKEPTRGQAYAFNSQTGLAADPDIKPEESHASCAKTILHACGVDQKVIDERVSYGRRITKMF